MSERKVALITGASAGLGLAIARCFAAAGYRLALVARDSERLHAAIENINAADGIDIEPFVCDVTDQKDVARLMAAFKEKFSRLDVLINNVGMSDRGLIKSLPPEHLDQLFCVNVRSALLCSQHALPLLEASGGQIVNIGSLAAKAAPRYLGGYAAVKHALGAVTQQLRLEMREAGVNVMLISPGPIRREDAGQRYANRVTTDMPQSANRPAGGTTIKGLDPDYVARRILRACERRSIDVILPGYLRPIVGIGHLIPWMGDRLLLWFTRNKKSPESES